MNRQRGAALVVGLMMLVIVTLLAVTAVSTSSTELIMAGNEQFRERSFQAAEAGVETAFRKLRSGDSTVPILFGTYLDDSNVGMGYDTRDVVSTRMEPYGGAVMPNSSDFIGAVYRITSTGRSVRNANTVIEAGVYVLAPNDESNKVRLQGTAGGTNMQFRNF